MWKRSIVILGVAWIVILVASISSAITLALTDVNSPLKLGVSSGNQTAADNDPATTAERYSRLDEVRRIMQSEYYLDVDEKKLVDGAIRGMLASVEDEYTFYYTTEEMQQMNEHSEGVYEGIGLMLSGDKNGMLTVLRVFHNSPSQKSGILAGDRILSINGTPISGETSKAVNDAIDLIKRAENKRITLTLTRDGQLLDVDVIRERITVNRVDYQILDGNIGYLAIYEFMGDDVSGFMEAIAAFEAQGVKGMVIDLRSNPGGMLTHVVEIADTLLPEGLIVYIEDRYGKREEYFSDANRFEIPMTVLVNKMSASASEILASALKDYGLATVVGEKTYGKGIVQTVIPFRSDGAGLQLTTARYYTPKGVCIHGTGVDPDVTVEQNSEFDASITTVDPEKDAQLRVALEELQKRIGQ